MTNDTPQRFSSPYVKWTADWEEYYIDVVAMEADIGGDFKFMGEGWYFTETDTMLITLGLDYVVRCWNHKATEHPVLQIQRLTLSFNQPVVQDMRK